jgi:hypothetical protein
MLVFALFSFGILQVFWFDLWLCLFDLYAYCYFFHQPNSWFGLVVKLSITRNHEIEVLEVQPTMNLALSLNLVSSKVYQNDPTWREICVQTCFVCVCVCFYYKILCFGVMKQVHMKTLWFFLIYKRRRVVRDRMSPPKNSALIFSCYNIVVEGVFLGVFFFFFFGVFPTFVM